MTTKSTIRHSSSDSQQQNAAALSKANQDSPALSDSERLQLVDFEETIANGLETFFEVGSALLAIRDGRLYRDRFQTFEAYCIERWGFGRTYAWRVIGAAQRFNLLPPGETRKPTSEFQMRPFLKLKPHDFPPAWRKVLEKAKDERVTSKLIDTLIASSDRKQDGDDIVPKPRTVRLARPVVGEILVLLHCIRRRVEANQTEQVLPALERIEKLLFES
jgi:hypothetical protein